MKYLSRCIETFRAVSQFTNRSIGKLAEYETLINIFMNFEFDLLFGTIALYTDTNHAFVLTIDNSIRAAVVVTM